MESGRPGYKPQKQRTQGKSDLWHQALKIHILLEYYFLPNDFEAQIKLSIESTIEMSVSFGTSGLRGRAELFDVACVTAYVFAFLDRIGVEGGKELYLGCDLLETIFVSLGAKVFAFGATSKFVAVDTEA